MMEFLVQWFESLPSTNTYLRERLEQGKDVPSGTVAAAREQTAGRGRFDRAWIGAPGRDLAFSFVLRTEAPLPYLPSLSMAVALGVAETLETHGVHTRLKWPNDVLVERKKICGILSERVESLEKGPRTLVVGVGLNVNMEADAAAQIPKPATSLRMETGRMTPIEPLLNEILGCLRRWIERWEVGGFAALREGWLACSMPLGTPVSIETSTRRVEGTLAGYGKNGELLVRDPAGAVCRVGSGDLAV